MSSKDRIINASKTAPADDVVGSSESSADHIHRERSERSEASLIKVLATLEDLSERMYRMESSQSDLVRQHR